jgi:hypothetical protein
VPSAVQVTRRGRRPSSILQDDETLAALSESEEDVKAGRVFSLTEVRGELSGE